MKVRALPTRKLAQPLSEPGVGVLRSALQVAGSRKRNFSAVSSPDHGLPEVQFKTKCRYLKGSIDAFHWSLRRHAGRDRVL